LLRSETFDDLLDRHREIRRESARLSDRLVEDLFELVPRAPDRHTRRRLLALKRSVFNRRPLPDLPAALPHPITVALCRLERLRREEETLFDAHRSTVLDEIRTRIGVLIRNPRFRLACGYTSPALEADIRSNGVPDEEDLTPLERGLYSYAARFVSKANPFHLFAALSFHPSAGLRPTKQHETILDLSLLLDLERRILPHVHDEARTWLQLAPFRRGTGPETRKIQFWVTESRGVRLVPLAEEDLLELVLGFFRHRRELTGRPAGTRLEWREFLRSTGHAGVDERATKYLAELVRRRIVREYLVTDPAAFVDALGGLHPLWNREVETLARHHLAMKSFSELPEAHRQVAETGRRLGRDPDGPPPLFVNTFHAADTESVDPLLPPVLGQLAELKPFFGPFHNMRNHARVLRAYLVDLLKHNGSQRVPLLPLLQHYLGHRREVIARYAESTASSDEVDRLRRARARLFAEEGTLDRSRLLELIRRAPDDAGPDRLCFVGPFDPTDGIFYVTNVFAGHGRYLRRYLLADRATHGVVRRTRRGPGRELLDVELVVPPPPNLNHVPPSFPTGCGFEARWSHRFERWVDPAELAVERRGDEIGYRWTLEDVPVRIRYCGLQLAQHLPAEYQLLLLDQADTFDNPFARDPGGNENREAIHTPELRYRQICLRRESWSVPAERFSPLLAESDALRFATHLRGELQGMVSRDADHWYYSAPGLGRRSHKPRFLDLRNPLSAHAFRRTLGSMGQKGRIVFSEMRPGPDRLLEIGPERRVTELMLEV